MNGHIVDIARNGNAKVTTSQGYLELYDSFLKIIKIIYYSALHH